MGINAAVLAVVMVGADPAVARVAADPVPAAANADIRPVNSRRVILREFFLFFDQNDPRRSTVRPSQFQRQAI